MLYRRMDRHTDRFVINYQTFIFKNLRHVKLGISLQKAFAVFGKENDYVAGFYFYRNLRLNSVYSYPVFTSFKLAKSRFEIPQSWIRKSFRTALYSEIKLSSVFNGIIDYRPFRICLYRNFSARIPPPTLRRTVSRMV